MSGSGPHSKIIDFSRFRVTCANCNLSELCLPRGIDRDNLETLSNMVHQTSLFDPGQYLFRAGDKLENLIAIRTGTTKLFIVDETGEEQIVGFYFPGEILGLDAIETESHTCNAVALDSSSYCTFPYSQLDALCKNIPALRNQMFRFMSREITHENKLILTLNKRNSEEKLATFLITLSERFKRLGYSATEFKLSMSRQDIGNYLGLTIETVSRVLSRFNKEGLISLDRKQVRILDYPALKDLCASRHEYIKKHPSS
ncbi:MAG: fumarate/nitrate reduction transcriptional regulator Fnr [Thiotrichales bacterium]|nr:fumarate/nitrate reduction transcriptional regulator Fnr [Thiotrichales bacterium]